MHRTPNARLPLAVTVVSVALAYAFFLEGYPALIYDAWGYYQLSEILRTKGLAAWPVEFRTYGYPLFLAAVSGFRSLSQETLRLAVFGAQLALYLATCAFLGRKVAAVFESESMGAWVFAIAALNPVLLLHTTEPLSDLLSAVLIELALLLSWRVKGEPPGVRTQIVRPLLAFFCAAAATEVRPANVAVVAALAAVWLVRAVRWRDLRPASAAAAIAGLIPPLLPQFFINYRVFGRVTPLIVQSLYRLQMQWGMGALKYGTLVIPGRSPFLTYVNPLYRGDPDPVSFLRHHPFRYLATLALHAFAMLDYDLPFTYITDLHPWYRWPLSLLTYAGIALALLGLALSVRRAILRRRLDESDFALGSIVLVGAAYLVLYLPVEVENRFGLTLVLLMTPLVVVGGAWLLEKRGRPLARRLAVAAAGAYVLASLSVSVWISGFQRNPYIPHHPANAQVMDPARAPARAGTPFAGSPSPAPPR